jgi:hypothetical protein
MDATWQSLIVRPGDKVRATGKFVISSDSSATMCGETGVPLAGDPTACSANLLVPVVGIDPNRLAYGGTHHGRHYGTATIIGRWSAGQLEVEQQFAPDRGEDLPDFRLPCPPPAGGWRSEALPSLDQLQDHLYSNPTRYGPLRLATIGPVPDSTEPMTIPQVAVVPVVGNLDSAREELTAIFSGNLCVVPAVHSILEWAQAQNALRDLMRDTTNAVSGFGSGGDRPIELHMLLLTEDLYRKLEPIGLELMHPYPSIVPVSWDGGDARG